MNVSEREKKLLVLIPAALLLFVVLRYSILADPETASPADNTQLLEQQAARLRRIASTVAARETVYKQTTAEVADRERGIIVADTAPQAQSALLEIARRAGKTEQLDVRSGEFAAPKAFGDYGMVYASISFDCHIDQLVNFLATLAQQPELVVPSEQRISSGNPKEKLMNVRMTLAGVVSKRLIPIKKGLGQL